MASAWTCQDLKIHGDGGKRGSTIGREGCRQVPIERLTNFSEEQYQADTLTLLIRKERKRSSNLNRDQIKSDTSNQTKKMRAEPEPIQEVVRRSQAWKERKNFLWADMGYIRAATRTQFSFFFFKFNFLSFSFYSFPSNFWSPPNWSMCTQGLNLVSSSGKTLTRMGIFPSYSFTSHNVVPI